MKLKHLISTAGLGALAAALAVATPAQAAPKDRGHGGWSHQSNNGGHNRSDFGSSRRESRSDFRASRTANRPEARTTQRENWRESTPQRNYARRDPAPVQRADVPASAARYRAEQARTNAGDRYDRRQGSTRAEQSQYRSYVDPRRDRSYGADNRTTQHYSGSRGRDVDYDHGRDWNNRNDGRRHYDRDGDRDHRHWDRDWRHNNRYNWHNYRNRHRSVFHLGFYYAPYSYWSYRPLSIGFYLDPLFYSSRYWIDDPWTYRLPDAYGPYRWVRYYDDALLVNVYTGEVVDVIHDFFW